jgi:hypothetical protein
MKRPDNTSAAGTSVQPDFDPIGRDGYLLNNVPDDGLVLG